MYEHRVIVEATHTVWGAVSEMMGVGPARVLARRLNAQRTPAMLERGVIFRIAKEHRGKPIAWASPDVLSAVEQLL